MALASPILDNDPRRYSMLHLDGLLISPSNAFTNSKLLKQTANPATPTLLVYSWIITELSTLRRLRCTV